MVDRVRRGHRPLWGTRFFCSVCSRIPSRRAPAVAPHVDENRRGACPKNFAGPQIFSKPSCPSHFPTVFSEAGGTAVGLPLIFAQISRGHGAFFSGGRDFLFVACRADPAHAEITQGHFPRLCRRQKLFAVHFLSADSARFRVWRAAGRRNQRKKPPPQPFPAPGRERT